MIRRGDIRWFRFSSPDKRRPVLLGADEGFSLTEAQENELLAAMAEIERGEYVTLEELLQSLPNHD